MRGPHPIAAAFLALATLAASATAAHADAVCEDRIAKLRFDDTICPDSDRTGFPGALKDIPLADGVSLSIGGEVRQRYEYTQNPAFGADPQDENGVWMQRLTLYADLQLGPHLRVFGQAYHAVEAGRAGGPSPVDENLFEFQNAFVDLSLEPLTLRLGRQEMEFGSGRLVSVREGPNNRRNFDGTRLTLDLPGWQIDAIAARPVTQNRSAFDDQTSDTEWLWGLYGTGGADLLPAGALDLYYLGFRDDAGGFVQGTGAEERHSLGTRFFGSHAGWDWNWEAIYQFGSFDAGDIRAWTVATDTGVTFASLPWQPRLGLSVNVASGDDDPADRDLGTFNALFPRGNYFSEAAVLGPRNFFNVNPSIQMTPARRWTASLGTNFYWRLDTADGVYTPSGQILRAPGGSGERFVGTGLSVSASYRIAEGLDATAIYTRLFAGEFLRATGPGEDIDFFEATLQYKF